MSIHAQQTYCPNADLSQGNFTNWSAFSGVNTYAETGIVTPNQGVNSQHSIMSAGNYDPNLLPCLNFPVVPNGYTHSAMVGDYGGGVSHAAKLTYDFLITPQSNLITVLFALVGRDGGEGVSLKPECHFSVYDAIGNPLPASFYQSYLSAASPGWQSCGVMTANGIIVYKDWQQIGLDASAYMGQTLTLEIAVTDCQAHLNNNIHFFYGYVVASCAPLDTYIPYCPNSINDSVTLVAPSGFSNYTWQNAATGQFLGTGQSFSINSISSFTSLYDSINCEMQNQTGGTVVSTTIFEPNPVQAAIIDTNVCAGDITNIINNSNYQNFQPSSTLWSSSDGYTSNSYDFSHIFPSDGSYNVQLITSNTLGCIDTVSANVLVYQNPTYSFINQTALDTFYLNGQIYTQTGNYTQTLPSIHGCDSVIVLNLTVNHTGLYEDKSESFILYPNPVDQQLFIKCSEDNIGKKYVIYNCTGIKVMEGIINGVDTIIQVDKFDRGIYFFRMKDLDSNPTLFSKL
jgi:hypothetical protein